MDDFDLFAALSEGLSAAPADAVPGMGPPISCGDPAVLEDMEPGEQLAFYNLRAHVRSACNVNSRQPERMRSAAWLMNSATADERRLTLAETCRVFNTWPGVVQAFMHRQLFNAAVPFPEPLPTADAVPSGLAASLRRRGGSVALALYSLLWRWPGARADLFLAQALAEAGESRSAAEIQDALEQLESWGYIARKQGFWYSVFTRKADLA